MRSLCMRFFFKAQLTHFDKIYGGGVRDLATLDSPPVEVVLTTPDKSQVVVIEAPPGSVYHLDRRVSNTRARARHVGHARVTLG